MTDLYSRATWHQGYWVAEYRTPGRKARYVKCPVSEQAKAFTSKYKAAQAASDAMCEVLADPTTGFFTPLTKTSLEAGEVFKNFTDRKHQKART